MNLKYSKLSVFGIMAVYKQEKWRSDLDIKTRLSQYSFNAIIFYHRNIKLQQMNCKFFMDRFSTSVPIITP